jgi:Tol biopolymer transport system component
VTPAISADGSTIAFASDAGNLSSTDVDGVMDIFVTKRETIGPALISLLCNFPPPTPDGGVACLPINFDGSSRNPSISASGEVVAFETDADHLAGDDNGVTDVYVTDLTGGGRLTERVSVADDGSEAQGASRFSSVSADGTLVAFASEADNLVAGVTRTQDIFIRSRSAHTTMRASVNRDGDSPDGVSRSPRLVPDGSAVAFASDADDLVAQDANGLLSDVFTASICVPDSSEGAVSSLLRSVVGPNAGPFQGSIELLGCSVASWGL